MTTLTIKIDTQDGVLTVDVGVTIGNDSEELELAKSMNNACKIVFADFCQGDGVKGLIVERAPLTKPSDGPS